jgi:hypothetical protein
MMPAWGGVAERRNGRAEQLRIAWRLRQETSMSLRWIAQTALAVEDKTLALRHRSL